MKQKYLILADGKSPHTLKWIQELTHYFDVYLISLNGVPPQMEKILKKESIFVLNESTNPSGKNYKLILTLFKIRNILHKLQPHYINAHYLSSYGFLAALAKSSVKNTILIQSLWGSDVLVEPFLNRLRYNIARYALNKADYITADSFYVSDIVAKIVSSKECIVFPFGFNKIEHYAGKKEKIVFSNRALKKSYCIDTVLRWFALQDSSYRLVISNDGPEKNNLFSLAKELRIDERTTFVGYLSASEQQSYYQDSTYFISIPQSDATSVSLLEAMQFGTIPIVSNIPANREWILDGINGHFFDPIKRLEEIQISKDFATINQKILHEKALFPQSIERFIKRISK
jgi:glycosyltransferase involved in cell wall biosynthesis